MQPLGEQFAVLIYKTAGMFMQYLAPFILVLAALLSWFKARQRRKLVSTALNHTSRAPLFSLSWKDFEELTAEVFRRRGYSAQLTQEGADGGVDVILRRKGETFLVQCKHWRSTRVGVDVVRGLFGLIAAQGATGGFVVTAGDFTKDALDFAKGRNIELVHANELLMLLETREGWRNKHAAGHAPICPDCCAQMVLRTTKKGANKGRTFYGCSQYPGCKATMAV